MKSKDTLRKLYFVNSALPEITGNDLYYADQIRQSIEATLETPAAPLGASDFERFTRAVLQLREQWRTRRRGFEHWDAAGAHGFSPLWARTELVKRLKKMAAQPEATLLVTNLADAVRPRSGRWTRRARADYDEAVAFIRDLACRWTTSSARLTLLVC